MENKAKSVESGSYEGGYLHSSEKYPDLKVGLNIYDGDGKVVRSALLAGHVTLGAQGLAGCVGFTSCPLTGRSGNEQARDLEAFLLEDFLDRLGDVESKTYKGKDGEIKLFENVNIGVRYVEPQAGRPEDLVIEELF